MGNMLQIYNNIDLIDLDMGIPFKVATIYTRPPPLL